MRCEVVLDAEFEIVQAAHSLWYLRTGIHPLIVVVDVGAAIHRVVPQSIGAARCYITDGQLKGAGLSAAVRKSLCTNGNTTSFRGPWHTGRQRV